MRTSWLALNTYVRAVSRLIGYQSLESSIVRRRRPRITQATRLRVLGAARTAMAVFLTYAMAVMPAAAQQQQITPGSGGTILNGSFSGPSELGPKLKGAFLFEPEFPLASLKGVPIWNELEQLLDDPYLMALCSSLTSADPLVQTTPGTTTVGHGTDTPSPSAVVYPAYCSDGVIRRPGFGVTLPPLLLHPLNYNPTDGEEMRLLNPNYPGGTWMVPDILVQCSTPQGHQLTGCAGTKTANNPKGVPVTTGPFDPNRWVWTYKSVQVSPGTPRVQDTKIDYNAPIKPDINTTTFPPNPASFTCLITTEVVPAEGSMICGGDTGEPSYFGFGVNNPSGYSRPAVPGGTLAITSQCDGTYRPGCTVNPLPAGARLFDPAGRGNIIRRANGGDPLTGAGGTGPNGLRKPSLRVPPYGNRANPGYLVNTNANNVVPSNENDYVRNRQKAAVLGKALFWEQQVGSDTVQACGSCHAHAGADNRTKNQMNPNDIQAGPAGPDFFFEVGQSSPTLQGANHDLVASDFPIHKLRDPEIAGDPACSSPIVATINAGVLENTPGTLNGAPHFAGPFSRTVCAKANIANQRPDGTDQNDVASSMGVHFGMFRDIPPIGTGPGQSFGLPSAVGLVRSLLPDLRRTETIPPSVNVDPIPGFAGTDGSGNQFRRVEPRNTPTVFAAALNFDNFWDGRARHDFNGGSVFGAADPQKHVFITTPGATEDSGTGLTATRQIIRFVSIASLATGPALSKFEMSFDGRNWAKIGKKLLQAGVTPLANQLVDPTDGVLGPYSNQNGSACGSLLARERSPGTPAIGKPGLCINYPGLIRRAFNPHLWSNSGPNADHHLNGCYTDGRTPTDPLTPNCASGTGLAAGLPTDDDPFDHYLLTIANGAASATNTNQFTHMEANMSLFFGLSVAVWATLLMPDNTPLDQFLDKNPDQFESIGEVGEPGLVGPLPVCTTATQRHCFREVGNFKRDATFADPNANNCLFPHAGEGVITQTLVSVAPCKGTRTAGSNQPDPLLGLDIFQGSNLSLKNPNFRAARCGECHAGATLTDNTMPFTFKAQLLDFIGEFITAGNEALVEPLGMTRVITGFLLESELNENGQDAVERRIINQSIVPSNTGPLITQGLAFPDGITNFNGVLAFTPDSTGAGSAFFDNGVYNLGVTICEADQSHVVGRCDDIGRGANDAFGWPMSLAALLMKNLGGNGGAPCADSAHCSTEPGQALVTFNPSLGNGGGLFEETAQDQLINPGESDDVVNPKLPPYLAPFANKIPVGDSMPELDEIHAGINTLTDIAITEGFIDVLGPFNPAGVLNESYNNGDGPEMGTWPMVNRVGRFGSIKAPQLREVELTGPYFHNGGKLTLRQVVDFYVRGGDYPITNAEHRDFNIINLSLEKQSNLTEEEKVALVDFLLELTDDRVRFERAPFDHPELILPLDGTAPENTGGRVFTFGVEPGAMCDAASQFGPGQRACGAPALSGGRMFLDVPATGTAGNPGGAIPNFLGISNKRLVGPQASGPDCSPVATSQYCH